MDPGCDVDVMTLLEHQVDAVRARNRAYEREILNREQSTLYLTCFDQAMVLSSRLGFIFSDNVVPNPPPANTVVFGPQPLAYPDWGATHTLAIDMDTVVSPILDGELTTPVTSPGPAQFNFLPKPSLPNALTTLVLTLKTLTAQIANFQQSGQDAANVAAYISLVTQINNLVNGFPSELWSNFHADLLAYNNLVSQLNAAITLVQQDRNNVIAPLLNTIHTDTMNPAMDCTKLDDAWDNYSKAQATAAQFYPPEGQYFTLSSYYTLQDIMQGTFPPGSPPTTDFTQELATSVDSSILQAALADLSGPLSQPGINNPIWPQPPTFSPTDVALDVIKQM